MWPFNSRKSTSKEQTAPFVAPAEFRAQLDAFIAKNGLERPAGALFTDVEKMMEVVAFIVCRALAKHRSEVHNAIFTRGQRQMLPVATIAVASGVSFLGGDQAPWETVWLETNLLLLIRTGEMDAAAAVIAGKNYNVGMQVEQTKKMLVGIGQYAAAAVSTNADDVLASAIELVVCWVIAAGTL